MNGESRRTFLLRGLFGATALTACTYDQEKPPLETTSVPQQENSLGDIVLKAPTYTISDVRSGRIDARTYLNSLANSMPEVVQAKDEGRLIDILYNPSDEELETLFTEYFSERTGSEEALKHFVTVSMTAYKKTADMGNLGLGAVPGIFGLFAVQQPFYLVLTDAFVSSYLQNDADVRSLINHELQHNKDMYAGVQLGDIHLTQITVNADSMSEDYFENLLELRAYYQNLKDVFKERITSGTVSISPVWFSSIGTRYHEHWHYIKDSASTTLEKTVRDRQIEEFSGVDPVTVDAETFALRFHLFGKQDTITFHRGRTNL